MAVSDMVKEALDEGYAIERINRPRAKIRKKYLARPKKYRNYHFRAAIAALNTLYSEYEHHVKELQAEFERDEENREFENEYFIEYSRHYCLTLSFVYDIIHIGCSNSDKSVSQDTL